jgi:hypothetical protein
MVVAVSLVVVGPTGPTTTNDENHFSQQPTSTSCNKRNEMRTLITLKIGQYTLRTKHRNPGPYSVIYRKMKRWKQLKEIELMY